MESYTGIVTKGEGKGKKLGFPTINIPLEDDSLSGIYAATVTIKGSEYHAAAYADTSRKLLEAHILDFEDDLYGLPVMIELKQKIREGAHFSDDEELKRVIAGDIEAVRAYFI
ncbi:hypothetical protein A2765_06195 [Candidatus Kaiserbacteria bacterium RIFCSPHIGHO2_01_FULL_56_24]|uniref:riboflavin kinase n=1 Tax=Candidatus Kaiserbacteria bacterium RIFCSPHIGHO2_01_FULL_56_24 TaxID=1798487 RepID=A0A1F6D8E1_9BACT|nr:MAG: hypothetical protein A2765_06195 [Candidatus Kaiserbacteria bacterium RIFCSPHIGHO2_01_FULL_56_24]